MNQSTQPLMQPRYFIVPLILLFLVLNGCQILKDNKVTQTIEKDKDNILFLE